VPVWEEAVPREAIRSHHLPDEAGVHGTNYGADKMLGELLVAGDVVVINIGAEGREWGYDPAPDGAKATVLGFSEIDYGWANQFGRKPGMYINHHWVKIRLEDEREFTISSGYLEMADKEEFKKRDAACRDHRGHAVWKEVWLRELPETAFIEGDRVTGPSIRSRHDFPNGIATVTMVRYNNIGQFCSDNVTPMGIYSFSDKWPSGWSTGAYWADEQELELVERGWVWKYHNNVPIEFPDLTSKANFYKSLGLCDEVRNPACDLYKWEIDEAVDAIYSGLGHGISGDHGLFGSGYRTSVFRFHDEELGEQVRQLTMKGFPRAPKLQI
jgi:hypothetical protein